MPKPKLTPTRVTVKLPSGKTSTAIRHKNLVPAPGPGTPRAGLAVVPAFAPPSRIVEPTWVDDTNLDRDDFGPLYSHGFCLNLESGGIHEWDRHRSENSTPIEEYYGHVLAVTFPGPLPASAKAELFEEIRADLESRVAGYRSVWNGQNHVNGAPCDEDANDALDSIIEGYESASLGYQIKIGEARNDEFCSDLDLLAESLTSETTLAEAQQGNDLDGRVALKDRRTGVETEIYLAWGEDFDVLASAGLTELAEMVAEHDDDDDD